MNLLNLGCGSRFHKDWTNVDFSSNDKSVISHNLLQGVPFEANKFDVVYHSHILEHFTKEDGEKFITECFRVLKPGGVIRIAVPDLESITVNYLKCLEQGMSGEANSDHNYDWMLVEMYDQVKRHTTGGEFAAYFQRETIPNEEFVYQRVGMQGRSLRNGYLNSLNTPQFGAVRRLYYKIRTFLENNSTTFNAYRVGKFRLSGEVHLQMYDRYSLGRLLKKVGFLNPEKKTAFDSAIVNWKEYQMLDVENGTVRKPDSLFIEAIKPQN
jgi:predicted SAM-dependent methyltransferase